MDWLQPWVALTEQEKKYFEDELRREIMAHPILAGVEIEAFGSSEASDDVLYKLRKQGNYEFVVVHLVWNGRTGHLYPRTYFYKYWQDFVDNRMKEDNFGYE